ncbi:MAG TPA: sodium ion-translocating decarboxylase subunit beta, partial [Candidatus Limiplasma sp.]|nr:sodium ion-translocating decarboxylase subunit beta [Candidatus Limiplasma sp.]
MESINIGESLLKLAQQSGVTALINHPQTLIMLAVSCVLIYLAVVKKYEPLLLLPIAFGMLLTNLPLAGLMDGPSYEYLTEAVHSGKTGIPVQLQDGTLVYQYIKQAGGLLYYLYQGVKLGIYPPLIFLGVGAMTDFGPLIANPKSLLL